MQMIIKPFRYNDVGLAHDFIHPTLFDAPMSKPMPPPSKVTNSPTKIRRMSPTVIATSLRFKTSAGKMNQTDNPKATPNPMIAQKKSFMTIILPA
jgi:hypothetical protein